LRCGNALWCTLVRGALFNTPQHKRIAPDNAEEETMRNSIRKSAAALHRWGRALSAALGLACGVAAHAQSEFPTRPVRMIVGGPAASSGDIGARLLSTKLAERLGQAVIVENKPGASGAMAALEVARAEPDGHTLLFTASWHSTAAAVKKSLPYDTLNDFTFVSTFMTYGMLVGVRQESPFMRLEDLIAYTRANPGKLTFYSVGAGSAHHLIGEWINALTGAEMVHVPYKGSPAALPDLLSGRVDVMIDTMTYGLAQVTGGKVRALAITSREPMAALPGVPSISTVLPEMEYESWLGVLGPRGMQPKLLERINREIREIIASPEVAARIRELGATPRGSSPEEFRARSEREIARFRSIVTARRIPME
jgi:tripartite-type tricarboxylate transporter receptor subunit TctC